MLTQDPVAGNLDHAVVLCDQLVNGKYIKKLKVSKLSQSEPLPAQPPAPAHNSPHKALCLKEAHDYNEDMFYSYALKRKNIQKIIWKS